MFWIRLSRARCTRTPARGDHSRAAVRCPVHVVEPGARRGERARAPVPLPRPPARLRRSRRSRGPRALAVRCNFPQVGLTFRQVTTNVHGYGATSAQQAVSVVREHGWTPDAVQRASAALARAVAKLDDDDGDLAAEFVRWFRNACDDEIEDAVDTLNRWRPLSPATPQLDELYLMLAGERATPALAARLQERYADPVKTLIAMLDAVYRDDDGSSQGHSLDQAHQTGVRMLALAGDEREHRVRPLSVAPL